MAKAQRLGQCPINDKENAMNTQAIVGISAVAATLVLGMFGFMMNIKGDIVGVHEAIAGVHRDMKELTGRVRQD